MAGLPELCPDEGVPIDVGTASVLLTGGVAELAGKVEPVYDMLETAELPGFTGPGLVGDETSELPGGATYPLEEPMELGPADEAEYELLMALVLVDEGTTTTLLAPVEGNTSVMMVTPVLEDPDGSTTLTLGGVAYALDGETPVGRALVWGADPLGYSEPPGKI